MNYTLNQLQIFLKIVETKSITKAAEELHLTQPAVSIQLKNFQSQFETPLTEIVGRKIYITDFGQEIAYLAQQILNQVNAINKKTSTTTGQLNGKVKLSIVSTGKYIMPYFLSGFVKQHSGVELLMDVTNKNKVVDSLENNSVDFALVSILPNTLHIDKLDLMKNKLYLVGNMEHKLHKNFNTKEVFKKLPFIFRETGSGTRQTTERFFERNSISISKKMELTSNEAVKQAIIAGLGYSIMPLIGIKNELQNNQLQIIPVKGLPIKTTWSLIWLKGKHHAPAATSLLNYIKSEKSKIIEQSFNWYEEY